MVELRGLQNPIVCTLFEVNPDEDSDYAALSYTWAMNDYGVARATHSMLVNGRSLLIAEVRNLSTFPRSTHIIFGNEIGVTLTSA